ncbi:CoA-binding protein [Lolliginicoccus suaedae]|uniref:CoA-binding protein n=1 Tax=Lolliginicoccus suaedae TaxID=2605429 RepID=UPI0011EC4499|nr:CoA-binding protein [Lolliginicoccus suaedae]
MTGTTTHTNDPALIRQLLATPATWAVVGLSTHTGRTAHGVSRWMKERLGHRIVPVHPLAENVFGEDGHASLSDIPDGEHIDVVDCFVNSRRVGGIVDEAIANAERLGITALWLQLGVIDEDAAQRATDAGLGVVMDTCPKIEYPRL